MQLPKRVPHNGGPSTSFLSHPAKVPPKELRRVISGDPVHRRSPAPKPRELAKLCPGGPRGAPTDTMRRRQLQRAAPPAAPPPRPTRRLRTRGPDAAALRLQPLRPPFPHRRGPLESSPSVSYFPLLSKLAGPPRARGESTPGKNVDGAGLSRNEGRARGRKGRKRGEQRAVPVILLILARVDLGSLCELLRVAVLVHVLHGGGAVSRRVLARSSSSGGGGGGGALYGAGFKMAAEEVRAPPAPSLYSRPARQSGGLLGGDVARAPARPLPGGAGSERREQRRQLPRRPWPPMGEAAGG